MPSYHGIYQKYSDELLRQAASLTVDTGTEDADYPVSLVHDDNPAHVAKVNSTSGSILAGFSTKQPAEIFSIIHANFDADADVRLQGHDTDSWGTPSFEAPIVIPAWRGTGTRRWPVNPWLDITEADDYDAAGFLFWRLVWAGNSENVQIGQLWLGETIRRYDPNIDWGVTDEEDRPAIVNRTAWNVKHKYTRGTILWQRTGRIEDCPDTLRDDLQAHVDDVDGHRLPWLLIPDGLANDARLVAYAETKRALTYRLTNSTTVELPVEEVARGLRPGS